MTRFYLPSAIILSFLIGFTFFSGGCSYIKYNRLNAKRWEKPITMFTRCNIKVLYRNIVTIKNLQASPITLPVGSEAKILGPKLFSVNSAEYIHDLGFDNFNFKKFFIDTPPDLSIYDKETLENIANAVARVGMDKQAVYIAMGPPILVMDQTVGKWISTDKYPIEKIFASNLWVYLRGRKFSKKIGVTFDSNRQTVLRTEGIWR